MARSPSPPQPADDARIREALDQGEVDRATELILREYGPAVYALLVRLHGDPGEADAVFSVFAERLWRSLGRFRGECSVRSWTYRVARAASIDHRRVQGRRPPATTPAHLERVAAQVRTATRTFLRTEQRTALQRLRDSLSASDQLLLVLRIDRGLSWREVAEVFREESEAGDLASLDQLSARLRQRYSATTRRLRRLAEQQGLLGS